MTGKSRRHSLRVLALIGAFGTVLAQAPIESSADLGARGAPVNVITPVFSQLVAFGLPSGFASAYENSTATHYVQESVPKGETVNVWTQMITLTGEKGLASNAQLTPATFLQRLTGGFQKACPKTFAAKPLGSTKVGEYDAFIALAGCGAVESGARRSEMVLLLAIRGSADLYTIQWAERGPPADAVPVLDEATWTARLKQLVPIKVCERVSNEPAPYPSCVDQR